MKFQLLTLSVIVLWTAYCEQQTFGDTVAYWRFEDGPADADVPHLAGDDQENTFSADILDQSGNGNDLSTWITGGCCGYAYRADVATPVIPGTGAANNFSVKNTGGLPGMFTDSSVSMPTGVDLETMMPSTFTVEASWKFENGGYRTVVGRDAQNVATSNAALSALYLQARPDNSIGVLFVDAAGEVHEAFSPPDYVQGFNFGSDPEGLTADWYHLAAVSDGSTLKMYVNNALVASTPITSADPRLAIGTGGGGDWHPGEWSVGRGLFNGGHTDRAYGFIDEVRISDSALDDSEFLFTSPISVQVNTTTGLVNITNITSNPIDLDFYQMTSPGGALSVSGWDSLDDQNLDAVDGTDPLSIAGDSPGEGWDQAAGSNANQLIEEFLREVGSTLGANQTWTLGNAFNPDVFGAGVAGDLQFTLGYNNGALFGANVTYVSGGLAGDFDGDGDVDGHDYLVWQANPTVGNLSDWEANYGSPLIVNADAIPEPASAVLLAVIGVALAGANARSASRFK